ncbi:prophage endopeptidase tail family protein [Cytobacillus stercorigallinarum]|uniref:prophage endopeptidase tail family protein n=1 Tax=Cytobacillus stercorigallinarum TaxID=2762240 RepID=UPI001CD8B5C1|nr:prophage endopeptidase tail family protein [Cytobacillus stercorigallinarum]
MTELFIFNQDDQPLTIISEDSGLISSPYRIEVNKIPETPFTFTVEADSENAKYVLEENKVVFRDHEGDLRLFVIKELDDSDGMDGPLTTATCEPEFLELAEHIILDKRFSDKTAQVALDAAVEGTGWIGEVEVDLGLASTNFYHMRAVDAIWEIIKVWGGEIKDVVEFDEENNIVARKIKIIQRLGKDTGQRFEIDHNTTEIGRQVLSYPVTAMYGWGASLEIEDEEGNHTGGYSRYIDFGDIEKSIANGDPFDKPKGQKWVGDPEAFASYRRIRDGVALHRFGQFSNQDYEDPEELLWATWDNLQNNNKPVVNYRLSVDLFDDKVSLGDTAIAIDRKFARPIEIQSRIIAMEYDLLDIDGTMVVEMGQFLELDDNRLEELEKEVEKIRDRPQQVTEGSFPDIKPTTPINVEAVGGIGAIQLYWDYGSSIYVKHYEVYGSQLKDFVPDTQHLLWRGNTSGFLHSVGTDQVWYYRIRAVNQHGTPSDWSEQVMGATHRVISDDILFGPDIAAELRELSKTADILADGTIYADMIRQDVYDQIQADSKQYTDAEITATEVSLMSELANKAGFDYVDGKIYLVNEELFNKVDNGVYQNKILQIDNSLDGLSLRAQNVEANVSELTGEVGNALSQIAAVDIKANGISTSVNELRSDFNNLEIGGRNLYYNSLFDRPVGIWGSVTLTKVDGNPNSIIAKRSNTSSQNFGFTNHPDDRNINFKQGQVYTLSFEVRGTVTTLDYIFRMRPTESNAVLPPQAVNSSTEFQKVSITFTSTWSSDSGYILIGSTQPEIGKWFEIRRVMLVEGEKETGWNPAPEDIDSRISSAETKIDQTAYDLTFKASTQEVNSLTGRMTSAESSIRLLSDDIELKVDRDGIIGAINVQPGNVQIEARLIDLKGDVYITDGRTVISDLAVKNAAIANAAISRAKLQDAIIGTAQIDNLAVTAAKIASVNADTINAGAIRGIDIYGSQFRSSDGLTRMDITGGHIRLRENDGTYVHVNPDGLFGYNSSGSLRFKADRTLVISAALGTSNANVYLAAMTNGEARVVNYDDIPGDGLIGSYRYLPLRASGFYGNFWNINPAISATHLYARPLSNGELRVTLNGTTDIYQPIRVESVKTNLVEVNSLSSSSSHLYIKSLSGGEIRATVSGTIDNYVAVRGSGFYGSFIDRGTAAGVHLYARPAGGGELQVTVRGTTDTYRPVRALSHYGNLLEVNTSTHLYLRPSSTGLVRVTAAGTTDSWRGVEASTFENRSLEKYKQDIKPWDEPAIEIVRKSKVYEYFLKDDIEQGVYKKKYGFVIGEGYNTPNEILSSSAESVDLYVRGNVNWKATQELISITDSHQDDINWLKIDNQHLKQTVEKQGKRIAHLEGLLNVA